MALQRPPASAQEVDNQVRTIVETIEKTTVVYGDTVIKSSEKVVSKKETESKANVFRFEYPKLYLFDAEFKAEDGHFTHMGSIVENRVIQLALLEALSVQENVAYFKKWTRFKSLRHI